MENGETMIVVFWKDMYGEQESKEASTLIITSNFFLVKRVNLTLFRLLVGAKMRKQGFLTGSSKIAGVSAGAKMVMQKYNRVNVE